MTFDCLLPRHWGISCIERRTKHRTIRLVLISFLNLFVVCHKITTAQWHWLLADLLVSLLFWILSTNSCFWCLLLLLFLSWPLGDFLCQSLLCHSFIFQQWFCLKPKANSLISRVIQTQTLTDQHRLCSLLCAQCGCCWLQRMFYVALLNRRKYTLACFMTCFFSSLCLLVHFYFCSLLQWRGCVLLFVVVIMGL